MALNHAKTFWLLSIFFYLMLIYRFSDFFVETQTQFQIKMAKSMTSFRPKIDPLPYHFFFCFFQDVPIPWKAIFTSLPLWAIVLAHFTQTWGLYTMMSELPLYFNQRLHLDLNQVTIASNNKLGSQIRHV